MSNLEDYSILILPIGTGQNSSELVMAFIEEGKVNFQPTCHFVAPLFSTIHNKGIVIQEHGWSARWSMMNFIFESDRVGKI